MSLKNSIIFRWLAGLVKTFRREFTLIFKDKGVVLFFVLLPILYPVVYAMIYNPEVAKDVPLVVVDECRTSLSREYVRDIDASQFVKIVDYEPNLAAAKHRMHSKDCYGIVLIPSDFEKKVMRGEQAHVSMYCDMSLMLRFRGMLISVTDATMKASTDARNKLFGNVSVLPVDQPIPTVHVPVGNEKQGLATAIMPGVLLMILHQSLLLGVMMMGVGVRERRKRNKEGYDPHSVATYPSAAVLGKALCYVVMYIIPSVYVLHFVPIMFQFPHMANPFEIAHLMLPFLLSVSFLGMSLQIWLREREDVFPAFVFSSIIFIFLAGVTWPRYAMSDLWVAIGNIVPGTWGVNAYVSMTMNGASLEQQVFNYNMLWLLTIAYFITAYLTERYSRLKTRRFSPHQVIKERITKMSND